MTAETLSKKMTTSVRLENKNELIEENPIAVECARKNQF